MRDERVVRLRPGLTPLELQQLQRVAAGWGVEMMPIGGRVYRLVGVFVDAVVGAMERERLLERDEEAT